MIVYISDSKRSTRELFQLINTYSKVSGYKINSNKSVPLHHINDKWMEKEIRETRPFTIATDNTTLIKQVKDLCDKNLNS